MIAIFHTSQVVQDEKYFQRVNWQYMVLDEAQAIKSSDRCIDTVTYTYVYNILVHLQLQHAVENIAWLQLPQSTVADWHTDSKQHGRGT